MVAGSYFIDQGVVLFFYFAAFVGFTLQLAVEWKIISHEKKQAEAERRMYHIKFKSARAGNSKLRVLRVGKLQYFFHRIGFLACLLQLIRYIDPYGAYGYFNLQVINFFAYNITALIIIALAGAFYLPIDLVYVVSLNHSPPASLKYMFAFSGFLTVVDANVSLITRERWCTGLFLVWIAAIQLFQVVLFDVAMWRLTRAIREMKWKGSGPTNNVYEEEARTPRDRERKPSTHEVTEDSTEDTMAVGSPNNSSLPNPKRVPRKKEDSLERALFHMHVFQAIANVSVAIALAGELGIGIPLLIKDPRDNIELRDPEKYALSGTLLYVVLQYGAIVIMLWYSYLDISVLWAKDDEASDELAALPVSPSNQAALGRRMPSNSQRTVGHHTTPSNSNLSKITTRDLPDGGDSTDSPGVSRQASQEFANLGPARSTDQLLAV